MVRAVRALMGWEVTPCDSGYGRSTIDIRHWFLIDIFVLIPLRNIGWILKAQEANSQNATKALCLLCLLRLVALLWLGKFKTQWEQHKEARFRKCTTTVLFTHKVVVHFIYIIIRR